MTRHVLVSAGDMVWIQTVAGDGTEILLGRVVEPASTTDRDGWLLLDHVSYVGNTGRHSEFARGVVDSNAEIEVYPPGREVVVQIRHIIRIMSWTGKALPSRTQ